MSSTRIRCSSLLYGGSGGLFAIQSPLPERGEHTGSGLGAGLHQAGARWDKQQPACLCRQLSAGRWEENQSLSWGLGEKVVQGGRAKTWRGGKKDRWDPGSTSFLVFSFHRRGNQTPASLQRVPEQTVLSKTDGAPPPFTHSIPKPPGAACAFTSLMCNVAYRACVATLRLLPLAFISVSSRE